MASERYVIRCPDWASAPIVSRESAERRLAGIVAGGDCQHSHEIVPLDGEGAPMGSA